MRITSADLRRLRPDQLINADVFSKGNTKAYDLASYDSDYVTFADNEYIGRVYSWATKDGVNWMWLEGSHTMNGQVQKYWVPQKELDITPEDVDPYYYDTQGFLDELRENPLGNILNPFAGMGKGVGGTIFSLIKIGIIIFLLAYFFPVIRPFLQKIGKTIKP